MPYFWSILYETLKKLRQLSTNDQFRKAFTIKVLLPSSSLHNGFVFLMKYKAPEF